jgi:L-alanine-DL-glutamate epimerase-like enolase superfamily enzyme
MSKATSARGGWQVPVSAVRASPYRIPADAPEGDGTFEWNATTLVVVELDAGGQTGIGYTYSDSSIVAFIANTLSQCVTGEEIGSQPHKDPARVKAARDAIGDAGLFVDANGAFSPREALYYARQFEVQQVAWFEEPVSSDDAAGLRFVREHAPFGMDIAAGEYGYTSDDFRRLLAERSVDVLQADVSRCGGITGFLQAAALCDAFHVPLSAHCAPALHLHVACAVPRLRHQEWFHDHVRIEAMLFDGAPRAHDGAMAPDLTRPGCGLAFKHKDAAQYLVT